MPSRRVLGGVVYDQIALIDTSAAVALINNKDGRHEEATLFMEIETGVRLAAVDVTAHETFTRLRYDTSVDGGLKGFDLLRSGNIQTVSFEPQDEIAARELVLKYHEHRISFHDALSAAVMLRLGIYKIFTFDRDFLVLGFEILPGSG